MPATRRNVSKIRSSLWESTVLHADKAKEYTERGEWLGAYYNTLLAALSCKHCLEANGEVFKPPSTNAKKQFKPSDRSLIKDDDPMQTLYQLYLAIPYYRQKVVQFQKAFACPSQQGTTRDDEIQNTDSQNLDCESIVPVNADNIGVYINDIIGNDLSKDLIMDTLIKPIRMPRLYTNTARALLFYGPPGTGKTMLAKAAVHELNKYPTKLRALFYAPTGEAFKGKYVGESEKKIVQFFNCASKQASELEHKLRKTNKDSPRVISVLFIDELDSIVRNRDVQGADNSVVANTTNTFLQMMDGINTKDNVVVIGATNLPWDLDKAVIRRFDQMIYIPLPDKTTIVHLLEKIIVDKLRSTLFASAEPSYMQKTRTSHECFVRWQPLHGITEEALAVLADDMVTTSKKVGYSPRDIARLCQTVFSKESYQASTNAFFEVKTAKPKDSKDRDSETSSVSYNYAPDMADDLLRCLQGTYVSHQTFLRLKAIAGDRLDTNVAPDYLNRPPFPQTIKVADKTGETPTHTLFTHQICKDAEHCHVYAVQPDKDPRYLLFRTVKVRVRMQTYRVSLYLFCSLAEKHSLSLKSLLSNPTRLWFILDDGLYELDVTPATITINKDPWLTAHPEPWTTDLSQSWLHSIARSVMGNGQPLENADASNPLPDGVASHFAVSDKKGIATTEITGTHRIHASEILDENASGKTNRYAHIAFHPQTFVDARKEVKASGNLKNIRALDTYQRTGEVPTSSS